MNLVELLTVEHAFLLARPGVHMLILSPKFPFPKSGWTNRRESVVVVRPDGSEVSATAHLDVTHLNIRSTEVDLAWRWPITVWLTDRTEEEVPVGSKLMVAQEVRDAICSPDPS